MKLDPHDRWVPWVFGIVLGVVGVGMTVLLVMSIVELRREQRAMQALSPAERAVEKHVMSDGTICYQPRAGWSRPLSCVRGEGK